MNIQFNKTTLVLMKVIGKLVDTFCKNNKKLSDNHPDVLSGRTSRAYIHPEGNIETVEYSGKSIKQFCDKHNLNIRNFKTEFYTETSTGNWTVVLPPNYIPSDALFRAVSFTGEEYIRNDWICFIEEMGIDGKSFVEAYHDKVSTTVDGWEIHRIYT